jgi:hypothetical protein
LAVLSLITIKTYYTAFYYLSNKPNVSFQAQLEAELQAFFITVLGKKILVVNSCYKPFKGTGG